MTHRITLGVQRKYRNQSEWRNIQTASYGDMIEAGDHSVIIALTRRMAAEGMTGDVEVWRDDVQCFNAAPLEKWASGKAFCGEQPEHLRKGMGE